MTGLQFAVVELTITRVHVVELNVPVPVLLLNAIVPLGVVGVADVSFTIGVQLVAWLMKSVEGLQPTDVVVERSVTVKVAAALVTVGQAIVTE